MKLTKRIANEYGGVVLEDSPIPPLLTREDDVLIKAERILLTPIDHMCMKGYLLAKARGTLGTFAYGRALESKELSGSPEFSTYPNSCDCFPIISREGVGYFHTTFPSKCAKVPPRGLEAKEFFFIYDLILEIERTSEGRVLVVGGEGLQTLLLSHVLEGAVFTGIDDRKFLKEGRRTVSLENIEGSRWDTVVINTLSVGKASLVLRRIEASKVVVNPFSLCLFKEISIPSSGEVEIVASFPRRSYYGGERYEELEEARRMSGLHTTAHAGELNYPLTSPPNQYFTLIAGNEEK
ncbi:hypothetical protein [Fervidicoccus fontis]|uniref:Uncharacterized protein n=1 Tax=Fervidicoccus fontis (strain DSM 19380 / JCM 18336 / VKM B-2539 / Kam940) TaxID=1163730 RepID=I0A312_FERFK|nr:hypothetical protein [Fervidicoccus fontis]AFH43369.1 hypothetical protein FFONT_1381 [Fervidicoccus fontis Kam940]